MEYEIHVTVESFDKQKFINDCKSIGVKPIVIEASLEKQVMTSSKYKGDFYKDNLINICSSLRNFGYNIVREKVEIKPGFGKNKDFVYYESHFRFKIPKDSSNLEFIRELILRNKFHLSRNLLKSDDKFIYQMATYRSTESIFFNIIREAEEFFKKYDGFELDKIEIEECIYDTNILIDKNWLKL